MPVINSITIDTLAIQLLLKNSEFKGSEKFLVKFRLSEKHTKFQKIFLVVLTNQLIYLINVKTTREIFFKLKSEL